MGKIKTETVSLSIYNWVAARTALDYFLYIGRPYERRSRRRILSREGRTRAESIYSRIWNTPLFSSVFSRFGSDVKFSSYYLLEESCAPEILEYTRQTSVAIEMPRGSIEIMALIIEIVLKNESSIGGLYDLRVIYCWPIELSIRRLKGVYELLRRMTKPFTPASETEASHSDKLRYERVRTRIITYGDLEYRFVWAPPGSYFKGAPETAREAYADETYARVTIERGFWILETVLTLRMLTPIVDRVPWIKEFFQSVKSGEYSAEDDPFDLPTAHSFNGSTTICAALSEVLLSGGERFELPTEDQWEYAALAGRSYEDANSYENIVANSWVMENLEHREDYPSNIRWAPHKPGEKAPNPWGLFDMQGNGYEWTKAPYKRLLTPNSLAPFRNMYVARGGNHKETWVHARTPFRRPLHKYLGACIRPIIVECGEE